jgi:UDP-N-acetylglucosamine:LPS N-acetylglucosamine transferase
VEEMRSSIFEDQLKDYHPFPYLHDEMGAALASADLAISRAGAATLGEYPIFGLPSILVPYPHAWRYQKVNADHLCQRGAAVQVRDEALSDRLMPTILELLDDPERLRKMGEAAKLSAKPTASRVIATEIERVAGFEEEQHG